MLTHGLGFEGDVVDSMEVTNSQTLNEGVSNSVKVVKDYAGISLSFAQMMLKKVPNVVDTIQSS